MQICNQNNLSVIQIKLCIEILRSDYNKNIAII